MNSATKIFTIADSSGIPAWSNPSRVTAEDGSEAAVSLAGYSISGTLRVTTPGFTSSDIPDTAVIAGISIRIKARGSIASTHSLQNIQLTKSGTGVGTAKSQADGALATVLTNYAFGGSSDTWGASWTPAEARAVGVFIQAHAVGNTGYAYIDVVEVTVYYTLPLALGSVTVHGYSTLVSFIGLSFGMTITVYGQSSLIVTLLKNYSLLSTTLRGASFLTIRTFISNMIGAGATDPLALLSFTPDMPGVIVYRHSTLPLESVLTHLYSAGLHSFQLNGGSRVITMGSGSYFIPDRMGNWVYAYINLNEVPSASATSELAITTQTYDINREFSLGVAPLSSLAFEEIARDVYGDPELGVLLRQLNLVDGPVGAQYVIPDVVDLSKEELKPQSNIFQNVDKFSQDVLDKESQDG